MNVNKVIIGGRLTKNPELRALPSGDPVCDFSVATNLNFKSSDGEKKQNTEFHYIVAFGKRAEWFKNNAQKGTLVYVEGRLQTRSWESGGKTNYKTEIVSEDIQIVKEDHANN